MNEHDYQNLQFLLNASEDVIADWFLKTSTDDIEYAIALLQEATECVKELNEPIEQFAEANAVLARFML